MPVIYEEPRNTWSQGLGKALMGLIQGYQQRRQGQMADKELGLRERGLELEESLIPSQRRLHESQTGYNISRTGQYDAVRDMLRRQMGGIAPRGGGDATTGTPTQQQGLEGIDWSLSPSGLTVKPSITPKDKLGFADKLRTEFNSAKAYKDYQTIQRSEAGMKQAYLTSIDPNTKSKVASDQALAVMFQKMLDPDSVVRESEYARTPEGVAAMNRILAYIEQVKKGGLAIGDEDRKALYDMAQKLLTEGKKTLNTHIGRYTNLAEQYNIQPSMVLGDIKPLEIGEKTTPSKSAPESLNAALKTAIDQAKKQLGDKATKDDILDLAEKIVLGTKK